MRVVMPRSLFSPGSRAVTRLLALAALLPPAAVFGQQPTPVPVKVETIVAIRHAEKIRPDTPHEDRGQLDAQGLNRSLALPDVLIGKFGRPDFIIAPVPTRDTVFFHHPNFYVRPLMTIEPTAIRLKMGVDTPFAFNQIAELQTELLGPAYANATVFLAWEHVMLDQFARNLVRALGGDPKTVPDWPDQDYDTIFVFRLRTEPTGVRSVAFTVDHEGLDGMSTEFPTAKGR